MLSFPDAVRAKPPPSGPRRGLATGLILGLIFGLPPVGLPEGERSEFIPLPGLCLRIDGDSSIEYGDPDANGSELPNCAADDDPKVVIGSLKLENSPLRSSGGGTCLIGVGAISLGVVVEEVLEVAGISPSSTNILGTSGLLVWWEPPSSTNISGTWVLIPSAFLKDILALTRFLNLLDQYLNIIRHLAQEGSKTHEFLQC